MKHNVASNITKQAFADALKQAVEKKPLSKITVSELVDICGFNRKTFYYHFDSVYALVHWILEQEAIQAMRQYDLLLDLEDVILFLVDYVQKNPYIRYCILDAYGRAEIKNFFLSDLKEAVGAAVGHYAKDLAVPEDYVTFLIGFYTEALAGYLVDFVRLVNEKKVCDDKKQVHYLTVTLRVTAQAALKRFSEDVEHG